MQIYSWRKKKDFLNYSQNKEDLWLSREDKGYHITINLSKHTIILLKSRIFVWISELVMYYIL